MHFTHTYVFGHLARIEPTGRANAAKPAMIMTGSVAAPLLGGVLVKLSGHPALGVAAATFAAIPVTGFSLSRKLGMKARQILLSCRPGPEGPAETNFGVAEADLPEPGHGQALVETLYAASGWRRFWPSSRPVRWRWGPARRRSPGAKWPKDTATRCGLSRRRI